MANRAGLHVRVNSRAEIMLTLSSEGVRSTVLLDASSAESLIEALSGACEAAREVTRLGIAADEAASLGLTDQAGELSP